MAAVFYLFNFALAINKVRSRLQMPEIKDDPQCGLRCFLLLLYRGNVVECRLSIFRQNSESLIKQKLFARRIAGKVRGAGKGLFVGAANAIGFRGGKHYQVCSTYLGPDIGLVLTRQGCSYRFDGQLESGGQVGAQRFQLDFFCHLPSDPTQVVDVSDGVELLLFQFIHRFEFRGAYAVSIRTIQIGRAHV